MRPQTINAFWVHALVGRSDECWGWNGARKTQADGSVYGEFRFGGGRSRKAHRIAYELLVGSIPSGMHVHHKCRNGLCINPAHLQLLTPAEHPSAPEHRSFSALNAKKTHCHRGHELSGANLKVEPSGSRRCLACAKINRDAMRARMRADLAAGRIQVVHGTSNAYTNYGCRCAECRDSQRAARERLAAWHDREVAAVLMRETVAA